MKSSILLFQIPKPQSIKIIKNLLPLKIKIRQIRPEESESERSYDRIFRSYECAA